MGILAGDIKLVTSQVMDDVDEGGGAPTSTIIEDGTSNSIFNDISELDRAGGRVNLRKVFANVQTPDTDTYLGANVIVADPPDDPNVTVTIFKASNTFDRRTDAQDRIEAYLNKASVWDGYLFENHIAGQRSIQIFHRPGTKPPVQGKTLYLVANEGLSSEYSQYVRITEIETATRTFSYEDSSGIVDFQASVSTCSLSDALTADFPGSEPSRLFKQQSGKSVLRDTVVTDAATYYGASKTSAAANVGAFTANVESIFTKIVPSAQTETALVDQPMTGEARPVIASASGTVSRNVTGSVTAGSTYNLPAGCYPGSLNLQVNGYTFTDDGAGAVLNGTTTVGTINYQTGAITFNGSAPNTTGAIIETYRPAAVVSRQTHSLSKEVTVENRAYVWVIPLTPVPAPGTTVLSYMAQGNWYDLSDDGTGVLSGADSAYGVGTVSFTTGTVTVTLGALPDVGSEIVLAWGTPKELLLLSASALSIAAPKIEFDFGEAVSPGTLTFAWPTGKTASDNGNGLITGDASGEIVYGTGTGFLRMTTLPGLADLTASYDTAGNEVWGSTTGGGVLWEGTIPNAPIKPNSVSISLQVANSSTDGTVPASSQTTPVTVKDDGAGGLIMVGYGALPGSSINYTTGHVILSCNVSASWPVGLYTWA